jgi:hypothetical protein
MTDMMARQLTGTSLPSWLVETEPGLFAQLHPEPGPHASRQDT